MNTFVAEEKISRGEIAARPMSRVKFWGLGWPRL
jgi:hypothetical protein